jgi:hypothetical protein
MKLLYERVLNGHCPICNKRLYSHVTDDLKVIPNNILTSKMLLDGMFVEVCSSHYLTINLHHGER